MIRAAVLLFCHVAVALEQIEVDGALLSDFTTDYFVDDGFLVSEVNKHHLVPNVQQVFPAKEHGTIQFSAADLKFQVKANGAGRVPVADGFPPKFQALEGQAVSGHGEFRIDARTGFASTRGSYEFMGAHAEFCIDLSFPGVAAMAPPADQITAKMNAGVAQMQAMMNQMPHKEVDNDGETIAVYPLGPPNPKGGAFCAFHTNGVPFGCDFTPAKHFGDHTPLLRFKDWHAGAGDIHEENCNSETSAVELLSRPEAMVVLDMLDRAAQGAQRAVDQAAAPKMTPVKPSDMVRLAAQKELAQKQTVPGFTSIFIVAGLTSALISLAVVAVMSRSKKLHREPLISDDA